MILKKGKEYTPIIFQHPDLVSKKCVEIKRDPNSYVRFQTNDSYKFDITPRITYMIPRINRLQKSYTYSMGVIFDSNNSNILAIIVEKDFQKYIIVDKKFSENWTTYFKRIKSSAKELGILTKNNLLIWESGRIYSEFQELLEPSMEDYLPENQLKTSSEFIKSLNIPYVKPFDLKIGDYVTITKSNRNWNYDMNVYAGKVVQITYCTNNGEIKFEDYGGWSWRYDDYHFRESTEEEINSVLEQVAHE